MTKPLSAFLAVQVLFLQLYLTSGKLLMTIDYCPGKLPVSGNFHQTRMVVGKFCYSQTRSSVPVANELMNSLTEK